MPKETKDEEVKDVKNDVDTKEVEKVDQVVVTDKEDKVETEIKTTKTAEPKYNPAEDVKRHRNLNGICEFCGVPAKRCKFLRETVEEEKEHKVINSIGSEYSK